MIISDDAFHHCFLFYILINFSLHLLLFYVPGYRVPPVGQHVHGSISDTAGRALSGLALDALHRSVSVLLRLQS